MASKSKSMQQLLEGYARVMLIWALLRTLMGLISIPETVQAYGSAGFIPILLLVLLVIALGIYLGVTGRLGLKALTSEQSFKYFKILCTVGLVLAGITICAYIYWLLNQVAVQGDLFGVSIDCLLYAVGVYYAWRIEKGAN